MGSGTNPFYREGLGLQSKICEVLSDIDPALAGITYELSSNNTVKPIDTPRLWGGDGTATVTGRLLPR